jgi:CDP-glucose 4,6-dehydratase
MFKNIYKDKTVLVTGNTGFKGSWLTVWLLQLGAKVIGLSDKVPTSPSMFEVLDLKNKIEHYFEDVNNGEGVATIIKKHKPDFVFHLAAQPIVSTSYSSPVDTIKTNVIGTAHVLEALRINNHPCTAVFITSDKCYENVEWTWGYRENDRLGGKDPYSASKAGAEIVIYTYYNSFFAGSDSPVRLVSARAGNVIGGGDWAASRIIPDAVRAWATEAPVVIRRPKSTRPWQHVLEPLGGYLAVGQLLHEQTTLNGESFNFGPAADQTFTVSEVLDAIAKNWSFKKDYHRIVLQEEKSFHEAGLLKLNCDKALNKLGWKPVLSFELATTFTAKWYDKYYHNGTEGMYDFTLAQLQDYVGEANKLNIEWAHQ